MTLATELNLEDPEVLERGRILFEQQCRLSRWLKLLSLGALTLENRVS
jgi:hypothetical protein